MSEATRTLYGLGHEELLSAESPEEVLESLLDDAYQRTEETFDTVADRLTWPVRVYAYGPMSVARHAAGIARQALEFALEILDEEHADPDGDSTTPTDAMKAAATAFAEVITREYKSWAFEKTGEVTEYTREQARAIWEERP